MSAQGQGRVALFPLCLDLGSSKAAPEQRGERGEDYLPLLGPPDSTVWHCAQRVLNRLAWRGEEED